jgi:2-dehydropantoate 2-reductase
VRFVVYGAGAIGGLVGARLHERGHAVTLVARGEHLRAIRARGLVVDSPDGRVTVPVPAVERPPGLGPGDVVLLTTKSQHTVDALAGLAAAPRSLPILCLQNGVANERRASEHHANVYGGCVMCPATHLEPGVVVAHRSPVPGILDVGRYPCGVDPTVTAVVAAFHDAGFAAEARPDIMRWKYAKLLANLTNAIEVIAGRGRRSGALAARARAEGVACLDAARIAYASEAEDRARRAELGPGPVGGSARGSSSWQSLERRTGDVETDDLNGEVVALGRRHGIPTPVNETLQRLATELARRRSGPGAMSEDELARLVP